ncbi:unnamed protein product [Arctogadus glacialis]
MVGHRRASHPTVSGHPAWQSDKRDKAAAGSALAWSGGAGPPEEEGVGGLVVVLVVVLVLVLAAVVVVVVVVVGAAKMMPLASVVAIAPSPCLNNRHPLPSPEPPPTGSSLGPAGAHGGYQVQESHGEDTFT